MTTAQSRPRNAAATADAILASAREAFVRLGYDGAGVREIAAGAGVTAMLVNRYFGSKEALFEAVLADIFCGPRILTEDLIRDPDGPRKLAQAVVDMTASGAPALDGFAILLRSAANERAMEIGRAQIEAHHQADLIQALSGPHASTRAGLILALVSGLQTQRQGLRLSSLNSTGTTALVDELTRLFALLFRG